MLRYGKSKDCTSNVLGYLINNAKIQSFLRIENRLSFFDNGLSFETADKVQININFQNLYFKIFNLRL